ncbi:hypothetical protein MLD38_020652 [Melastoma candidum]|uniref:Uncharacterized protein n=1 Tax=Melastoma candidum TaxID=119954 RepID=A0ACB9QHD1_9MYRT|nr:hypothetical protein MLD38_020652 [Melastoma candidum]
MGKKKLPNPTPDHAADPTHVPDADYSAETILKLKSLNAVLLKETTEKRRQVESLERRRDDLEVEVRRMGDVVKELEEELSRASGESVGLELYTSVLSCFLDAWRVETGDGVRRLVAEKEEGVRVARGRVEEIVRALESERVKVRVAFEERDAAVSEYDELVETARGLLEKLREAKEARRLVQEGLEAAKIENERLGRERVEGVRVRSDLMKEKAAVEKELVEVCKEFQKLGNEFEELEMVRDEVRRENKGKDMKIGELGKEVALLNGVEASLRKKEENLRSRLLELESLHDAALEKVKEREREIGALNGVNEVKETMILNLKGACDLLEKKLGKAEESLGERERAMEEMGKKRIEFEELVGRNGEEIDALNREIAELKEVIVGLESSCRNQEEKGKGLLEEVSSCKEALDGVKGKKDELQKLLFEERQNAMIMASKLSEMARRIAESTESWEAIWGERDGLIKGKNEAESKLSSCFKEKEKLEKRLSGAQQTIDDLEAKIKLAGRKYDHISTILKKTVVSLVKENGSEENFLAEQKVVEEEESQAYTKELDAIKSAFRTKECAVEELKQQLEVFKGSAARAQKEKGLWTLVSSAATLVAAASVAYVARGR